jgi:hypothetical protein
MKNSTTVYLFLALILASWVIEFGLGWKIMQLFYDTTWYGYPSSRPFAEVIASLGHYTVYTADGTGKVVDFHWTPFKVTLAIYVFFVVIHGTVAVWNGLLYPLLERWNQGVRRPVAREREQFEAAYAVIARSGGKPIVRPRTWLVQDGSGLDMRWRGYKLIIDRELLTHRYFPCLLAVQLAHANSEDRLAHRLYQMLPPLTGIVGILGGLPFSIGHVLLYPLWMRYWKERTYAADAFAVERGQGYGLVRALDEIYLRMDTASRGGRLLKPAPYIAQRIDRIQQLLAQGGLQAQRII